MLHLGQSRGLRWPLMALSGLGPNLVRLTHIPGDSHVALFGISYGFQVRDCFQVVAVQSHTSHPRQAEPSLPNKVE